MSLSITGFDANGRITPKGTDVVIPPESAGIGDLIYRASATDFIVIGRGTNSDDMITKNSKTYKLYAGIYGFVNGEAMIIAPAEGGDMRWANEGITPPSSWPRWGSNTVLMRNGLKTDRRAQMNTARNSNYITSGETAPVQLTSAYHATSLTASNFASSASAEIKARYGTWEEYIRQTLRVNGAPGSSFGAVATNVKVHEFGRWMTKTIHEASPTDYPAANYCATYAGAFDAAGGGNWWLPSMFELGELMIDEHLDKLKESAKNGFASITASSSRWSCVLASPSSAWYYYNYGYSYYTAFSYEFAVRPVSLFKLK